MRQGSLRLNDQASFCVRKVRQQADRSRKQFVGRTQCLIAAVGCGLQARTAAITSARAESEGFRNPKVFGTVREDCSRNCCCTQAILTPLWLSLVATQVRRCCPRNPNGAPDHDLKLLLPSEHHFRDYVEINKVGRILCGAREQETMSKRPFPSSS